MIIGLTGRRDDGASAGAGKDAVADVLVKKYGFVRIALADAVKRVARDLYDFSDEQCWGSLKEAPDLRYPREHGPHDWAGRCLCCGTPRSEPFGPQCYCTPRFALKVIGTEMGRTLYEGTWVRIALDAAAKVLTQEYDYRAERGLRWLGKQPNYPTSKAVEGVVIPDVRWPAGNEGKAILAAGGRLWRIDRPGVGLAGTAHASESQPAPDDLFAAIFKNDGTLADLEAKVHEVMGGGA